VTAKNEDNNNNNNNNNNILFTKQRKHYDVGTEGYEKHLWPPATKKERKMNNLNNQNLALKSVTLRIIKYNMINII